MEIKKKSMTSGIPTLKKLFVKNYNKIKQFARLEKNANLFAVQIVFIMPNSWHLDTKKLNFNTNFAILNAYFCL